MCENLVVCAFFFPHTGRIVCRCDIRARKRFVASTTPKMVQSNSSADMKTMTASRNVFDFECNGG